MSTLYDDFGSYDRSGLPLDDSAIEIFLDPGEYFVGDSGFMVRTLLGSCVSITLWHPQYRFGAMCHFLLSTRPKPNTTDADRRNPAQELDGKYADEVLLLMLRQLREAKISPEQCQAKIFGGGNMFPQRRLDDSLNIGKKNGETARMLLRSHGIPVISEDLYGDGPREIIFNVGNGDVWIRQVKIPA